MDIIQLTGEISIDQDTILRDPKCFIKGIYFDFEANTHRVDVVFYEIQFRHLRSFEIPGIQAPDPEHIRTEFLKVISAV